MSTALLVFFLTLTVATGLAQNDEADIVIGKYRKIPSKILSDDRLIMVHLPAGYEENRKKYPVLYVLGSDVWSSLANPAATVEQLSFEQIPEMIVIGVPGSTNARLARPVTPDGDPGGAEDFWAFVMDELVPFVERSYRTESYRILMGQSNSGLFATYVFLTRPDAFNAYVVSSPTLGWCSDYMNDKARTALSHNESLTTFFYMVYGERDYGDLVLDAVPSFENVLRTKAPPGLAWTSRCLEKEGHVPVTSLNYGLLELFPDYLVPDEVKAKGLAALDEHYATLTERYGFPIPVPEEVLFNMAYTRRQQNERDDAIDLFRILLERYPSSWRAHFFLGETYFEMGDTERAVECYEQALELRPELERAKQRLGALKR
jgi:predicted alpha/beta superfamily hydrolase